MLSLQPFDRQLTSKDGSDDVTKIRQYCELAAPRSPELQVYLYARWPRITRDGKGVQFDKNDYDPAQPRSGADLTGIDDFERPWLAAYDGGGNTNESRDYFDKLLIAAREATPKATPFLKSRSSSSPSATPCTPSTSAGAPAKSPATPTSTSSTKTAST